MIEVDGSMMEGGGQILRMAVTYGAVLGVPIRVHSIRAGRSPPGLRPQHLATLRAVGEMCGAKMRGLEMGSTLIEFEPGPIIGGSYTFDIGTAGSIGLLLQCVAPIASYASSAVELTVRGGTAVRWSPPVRILDRVVWRALRRMGFWGELAVRREGFYPAGGGVVHAVIRPVTKLRSFRAESTGDVSAVSGYSVCGRLPRHVAERQARSAAKELETSGYDADIAVEVAKRGREPSSPGSVIGIWAESRPEIYMGSSALGERGKPAERVGGEAVSTLIEQLRTKAAVDLYTADNLVIWCSLAEGESEYSMSELTMHTRTAMELACMFTEAEFALEERREGGTLLRCDGAGT